MSFSSHILFRSIFVYIFCPFNISVILTPREISQYFWVDYFCYCLFSIAMFAVIFIKGSLSKRLFTVLFTILHSFDSLYVRFTLPNFYWPFHFVHSLFSFHSGEFHFDKNIRDFRSLATAYHRFLQAICLWLWNTYNNIWHDFASSLPLFPSLWHLEAARRRRKKSIFRHLIIA